MSSVKPRLSVIGAGWLGCSVGEAWVRAGYEVMFATRHPEQLYSKAEKLGSNARVGNAVEAAKFGEILLFAVPGDSLKKVAADLRPHFDGKIVLDATNTSAPDNAAESAASLKGARLVRAFSAVDATAIEASSLDATGKLGVPIASDDRKALEVVGELVLAAGCIPVVVGDLKSAKQFQRGGPGFRMNSTEAELRKRLKL